jgi:hypothetical protein
MKTRFAIVCMGVALPLLADTAITRTVNTSCDNAWAPLLQTFLDYDLMATSDRTNKDVGLIELYHRTGESFGNENVIKPLLAKYTAHTRQGIVRLRFEKFRIARASAILSGNDKTCKVSVEMDYQGFSGYVSSSGRSYVRPNSTDGWYRLPSNGSLEKELLDDLEAKLTPKL